MGQTYEWLAKRIRDEDASWAVVGCMHVQAVTHSRIGGRGYEGSEIRVVVLGMDPILYGLGNGVSKSFGCDGRCERI